MPLLSKPGNNLGDSGPVLSGMAGKNIGICYGYFVQSYFAVIGIEYVYSFPQPFGEGTFKDNPKRLAGVFRIPINESVTVKKGSDKRIRYVLLTRGYYYWLKHNGNDLTGQRRYAAISDKNIAI